MTFRFDLVDLRLYTRVVEEGSITAGAEALRLSLAAASARVLAMEDSLGAPLLLRAHRGVVPTPAGSVFLLQARTVLQQLECLKADIGAQGGALRTQVQLWCNAVALHEVIPDLLGSYLVAHPHVDIALQERGGDAVVRAVGEGSADMGIVREGTEVFDLRSRPLPADPLVLVVPPQHALATAGREGPLPLALADGCDVVGLNQGVALQDLWDGHVAQRGRRLNYRVRVGSFDAQCRLVARGAGVAVMPQSAARRHARRLSLAIVPLADAFTAIGLRLCLPNREPRAPHLAALVEALLWPLPPAA